MEAKHMKSRGPLEDVLDAAFGLCCGYDWNRGNHAIMHGYRRKLLEAVNRIKPVPDFDGKIAAIAQAEGGGE